MVYPKPQNRAFEHALWKFHVVVGLKHEKKTEKNVIKYYESDERVQNMVLPFFRRQF